MATLATLLSIKLIILGYDVLCTTGFHQCRWGYKNVEDLRYVVENYKKANIPLDTMWNDIDYMQNYLDFTTDAVNYPEHELKKFIEELHEGGQQYVLILDPGMCLSIIICPPELHLILNCHQPTLRNFLSSPDSDTLLLQFPPPPPVPARRY
jgi:hypothetical protein